MITLTQPSRFLSLCCPTTQRTRTHGLCLQTKAIDGGECLPDRMKRPICRRNLSAFAVVDENKREKRNPRKNVRYSRRESQPLYTARIPYYVLGGNEGSRLLRWGIGNNTTQKNLFYVMALECRRLLLSRCVCVPVVVRSSARTHIVTRFDDVKGGCCYTFWEGQVVGDDGYFDLRCLQK